MKLTVEAGFHVAFVEYLDFGDGGKIDRKHADDARVKSAVGQSSLSHTDRDAQSHTCIHCACALKSVGSENSGAGPCRPENKTT